jgi:DUF4097 and DUF4098 domain-containing protein YvlB
VSARKIALLVLIVAFAASLETAWIVRGDVRIGPEGCRVMGGRFYGPSWAFEASAERAVAEGQAPRLEVENAFGGVSVSAGAPGAVKVKLRKVVFLPTEEKARAFADRIELRLTGDGALVRVGTNRDEIGRRDETGFETHLEIEAPPQTVVEVRSQHGRVELAGVAQADVVSSFEGVKVERVAGTLKLEARHGDVSVEEIGGGLELNSRHGNVSVSGVAAAARLDVQHGNVEVRRSAGLEVDLAHGELTAEIVGGDLVVRGQHAPVRGSDVTGRAEIETSFGDVRLERVGGELRARAQHGGVAASDVAGGANVEASHDGVTLERVAGPVEVVVQHGGVEAKGLARGARVRASGADVTLDGFSGPIDLEVERGSARLAPGSTLDADIVAQATHGGVQLEVPEGSRFDLDAESQRGRVDAPLEGITAADEGRRGQRASGRHGGGGVSVRLKADGDVELESRPVRSRDDWAVARPRAGEKPAVEAPAVAASPRPTPKPTPTPTPDVPAEAPVVTPRSPQQTSPGGTSTTR